MGGWGVGPCDFSVSPWCKSFFFPFFGDFYSTWGSVWTGARTWTWTRAWQLSHYTFTVFMPSDWLKLSITFPTPAYLGLSEPLVGLTECNLSPIRACPWLIFLNIRVIYYYLWRGHTWVSEPSEELELIMNVGTFPSWVLCLMSSATRAEPKV